MFESWAWVLFIKGSAIIPSPGGTARPGGGAAVAGLKGSLIGLFCVNREAGSTCWGAEDEEEEEEEEVFPPLAVLDGLLMLL